MPFVVQLVTPRFQFRKTKSLKQKVYFFSIIKCLADITRYYQIKPSVFQIMPKQYLHDIIVYCWLLIKLIFREKSMPYGISLKEIRNQAEDFFQVPSTEAENSQKTWRHINRSSWNDHTEF